MTTIIGHCLSFFLFIATLCDSSFVFPFSGSYARNVSIDDEPVGLAAFASVDVVYEM
jgi:hypothetical protein